MRCAIADPNGVGREQVGGCLMRPV